MSNTMMVVLVQYSFLIDYLKEVSFVWGIFGSSEAMFACVFARNIFCFNRIFSFNKITLGQDFLGWLSVLCVFRNCSQHIPMTTFVLLKHTNINHGNVPHPLQPQSNSLGTNNTSTIQQHHALSIWQLTNSNNDLNMYQMLMINGNMNINTFGILQCKQFRQYTITPTLAPM